MALLEVRDLSVEIATSRGTGFAVRGLNFALERGQTLGIVGESGCGKSMTALALMRLVPENARIGGAILFDGEDLAQADEARLCQIRGNRIAMIFQEPMTSLNPVHTIGRQIAEPLMMHRGLDAASARAEAIRLLDRVGIPEARRRVDSWPHQLSGGQRQRAMIAMALSCGPDILLADEPTTALDVTIQRQILTLIGDLVRDSGMSLILISHDLGVIAETVDSTVVMYGGMAVESGPTARVFAGLAHPYTQGLFAARPQLGQGAGKRLATIAGVVPDLVDLPAGCAFAGRCRLAVQACRVAPPAPQDLGLGHSAACLRLDAAREPAA
ncbi:MAG: ABC transporter ATP-binding protein [Alphaproteobacteria bacterium]|nr:ABC transporter ATP-binding protein [Alphaproteobacteria bacterium]